MNRRRPGLRNWINKGGLTFRMVEIIAALAARVFTAADLSSVLVVLEFDPTLIGRRFKAMMTDRSVNTSVIRQQFRVMRLRVDAVGGEFWKHSYFRLMVTFLPPAAREIRNTPGTPR